MGQLSTLYSLKLSHNQLTPKSLDYIKEGFRAGIFINLKILDLGYNELGDEGARTISHMFCDATNYFQFIEQINLQENNISDIGFVKLVKILVNVKENQAKELNYFCLRNNHISGSIRAQYMPIPSYISL